MQHTRAHTRAHTYSIPCTSSTNTSLSLSNRQYNDSRHPCTPGDKLSVRLNLNKSTSLSFAALKIFKKKIDRWNENKIMRWNWEEFARYPRPSLPHRLLLVQAVNTDTFKFLFSIHSTGILLKKNRHYSADPHTNPTVLIKILFPPPTNRFVFELLYPRTEICGLQKCTPRGHYCKQFCKLSKFWDKLIEQLQKLPTVLVFCFVFVCYLSKDTIYCL